MKEADEIMEELRQSVLYISQLYNYVAGSKFNSIFRHSTIITNIHIVLIQRELLYRNINIHDLDTRRPYDDIIIKRTIPASSIQIVSLYMDLVRDAIRKSR